MNLDLKIRIGDVVLDNPVIAPAGDLFRDGYLIKKYSKWGMAAIATKTISTDQLPVPHPCFADLKYCFINNIPGSDYPPDFWFNKHVQIAKEGKAKVIVSVAGVNPDDAVSLATRAEKAGADLIEIPTFCPSIPEILEAIGVEMPTPEFTDVKPVAEIVKAVKDSISVPIIVKLSSVFNPKTQLWATELEKAGADALAIADSFGPVMAIDIDTGQPLLGGPHGYGGMTGKALKPITLRMVFEAAQVVKIPIIGIGGISNWKDAVEYILAGASAIGLYTHAHIRGNNVYKPVIDGIKKYMMEKGYTSIKDFSGLTIKKVKERKEKNQMLLDPIPPTVNEDKCTGCRLCEKACVFFAIKVDNTTKKAVVDKEKCYGCGLCYTVCPFDAISLHYYK
ncbi:MAG: 4Fe-4S binding protein [Candidatus Odinarchaeota archaeon]|nr:4Fe-4S binding protein [Candidatus Odinarchaeota archaeon]